MTILELAQSRIPDLKKKTPKEWAGPCPDCGGTDRFLVWIHRAAWHCRGCNETGDVIAFLRKFEGMSCPEAHAAQGIDCKSHNCSAIDKCRKGNGQKNKRQPSSLSPAAPKEKLAFTPAAAEKPQQLWQQQAAGLIAKAHTALLTDQDQLDYLAGRGIPREAVEKGQLGWMPANRYPTRESWGLPTQLKDNKQPKKMFIPSGLLIPFFDEENNPHRIRIRRNEIREQDGRYYWLQGSGDDVPVLGSADRRGVVVVESDLDAFMVHWQCRDLDICVVPLGSSSVKPKQTAMRVLQNALVILVAHDFEPRINEKTGKNENPGGQGSRWWVQQFPRAERWPVPVGKDPGEAFQQGVDICDWVRAGLPPAFHVQVPTAPTFELTAPEPENPKYFRRTSKSGLPYILASDRDTYRQMLQSEQIAVFSPHEIGLLQGMDKESAELHLLVKSVFPGSYIKSVESIVQPEQSGQ